MPSQPRVTGPLFVGGHLAVDLVNTVAWRLDPERVLDYLPDGAALVAWCTAAGLPAGDLPAAGGERLAASVRGLRESLYEVLRDRLAGRPPPLAALRVVHARFTPAIARAEPAPALPLDWRVPVRTLDDLGHVLALAAVDLLARTDLAQLRQCAGPGCGWLFLDRSRSHTRRWCSSGDCGNRERARRHYARRR